MIVALDDSLESNGELFYDDGDSIDTIESSNYFLAKFSFKSGELKMTINLNQTSVMNTLTLETIRIMGLKKSGNYMKIESIKVNQDGRAVQILQLDDIKLNQYGELKLRDLKLKMNKDFSIKFNMSGVSGVVLPEINLNDDRLRF